MITIDHELYGERTEFDTIEEAETTVHACGPEFADAKFWIDGNDVRDERFNIVGTVDN